MLAYSCSRVNYITFIVNIGGNLKETFVAKLDKPGCHWTLLFIDATENKWFYCDTLGWSTPTDLKSIVDFILDVCAQVVIAQKTSPREACCSQATEPGLRFS